MERWVDIIGFEGYYQVSDQGRIKSLSRRLKNRYGYYMSKDRILNANVGYGGYRFQKLMLDKKEYTYAVHRLVAIHFLDKHEDSGDIVNHKDLDKLNNRYDNLEWCTHRENSHHFNIKSVNSFKKYSRFIGVTYDKNRCKWVAKTKANGKCVNLGRFDNELDAKNAIDSYNLSNNIKSKYNEGT